MPLYDYKCRNCGQTTEMFRRVQDRDDAPACPDCSAPTEKLITTQMMANTGRGSRLPCWVSHLDSGPGQFISTKAKFREACKKRDLVPFGLLGK